MRLRYWLPLLLLLAMSPQANATRTYRGLTVEYVDNYVSSDQLMNAAQVGAYKTNMTTGSGPNFTVVHSFANTAVFQTDFMDNEISRSPPGNDTHNWDDPGVAVSFYAGHGNCGDDPLLQQYVHQQFCNTSSDCNNPNGYTDSRAMILPGRCAPSEMSLTGGICIYNDKTGKQIYGSNGVMDWTVSMLDVHLRWGEDNINSFTNTVGANGGLNVAQIYNSCTFRAGYWETQINSGMFNGLILLQFLIPTAPDVEGQWNDIESSNFPGNLGTQFFFSPNGIVHLAWETAFQNSTGGQACSYGGGHQGISGCGAAVTVTRGGTAFVTQQQLSLTWQQIMSDAKKPTGNAYTYSTWTCNYDCSASGHPIYK